MAKDNFSNHATEYACFRPSYPNELIQYVASQSVFLDRALDVATGNGQVAIALAKDFQFVDAIDLSKEQIENAERRPNIKYQVGLAEKTPFKEDSFDLITVGQAMHWFDFEVFFREMKRIAKAKGVLAVWGYGKSLVTEDIDIIFNHFHQVLLGSYWDPERNHIEAEYEDINLPIERIQSPQFAIEVRWTREQYVMYIQTWSAVKHFQKANGYDPTTNLAIEFNSLWAEGEIRTIKFPIFIYIGKLN